jgi:hypothetical protein
VINNPGLWCAKVAILSLYLRLFGSVKWMRWCCWFGIIFSGLVYWPILPVYIVYQFPYGDEKWDTVLLSKNQHTFVPGLLVGAFNVVSDLYLLLLPLPVIASLKLSLAKRISLGAVFMTGIM